MKNRYYINNAFSLIELLIAVSIFSIISVALVSGISYLQTSSIATRDQSNATFLVKETFSIIKSLRNKGWNEFEKNVPVGLKLESGIWEIDSENGYDEIGKFRREVLFSTICRDNNDNIVECPGAYIDVWSLKVDIKISWINEINSPKELTRSYVLSNWNSNSLIKDNTSSFSGGFQSDVIVTDDYGDGDGSIILEPFNSSAGWGCFSPVQQNLDITGNDSVNTLLSFGEYVISGTNSSVIILNKNTFSIIGQISLGGKVNDMAYRNGFLYVGTDNSQRELSVVDLNQIVNPILAGGYDLPGSTKVSSISIKNDYLFVLTGNNTSGSEVNVYNVADVSVLLSEFEIGKNILKSEIYGEYLIIATDDFSQEVSVLNIGDIQNMSIVNSINLSGNSKIIDVRIKESLAYFTDNVSSKVFIYNLNEVNNPQLLNEFLLSTVGVNNPLSVYMRGEYFFFGGNKKVSVLKVINNTTYVSITSAVVSDNVYSIVTDLHKLYVGGDSSLNELVALTVLEQSSWLCVNEVGILTASTSASIKNINIIERNGIEYILFTQDNNGLFIYEKNGESYLLKDSFSIPNTNLNDLKIDGNYVYLATSNNTQELMIFDIADLSNIIKEGSFNSFDNLDATAIWVSNNIAYLGTRMNNSGNPRAEIYVINVTNKNVPILQTNNSYYRLKQEVTDIVARNGYIYVGNNANGKQIAVLNATNPSNITLLQNIGTPTNNAVNKLEIMGDNLFASNGTGRRFFNYNINSDNTLSLLGSLQLTFNVIDFSVSADGAFILTNDTAKPLKIIDNSNKATPTELISYPLKTSSSAVYYYSNKLYYSHLGSGVGGNLAGITVLAQTETGGGGQSGFKESGYYVSPSYDIGTDSILELVSWFEDLSQCQASCDIRLQIRGSDDQITWTNWFGANGIDSYFSNANGELIPKEYNDLQWIQYKIILTGNSSNTPIFNSINVQYK